MKQFYLKNNPYLGFEYILSIDFDTGKTYYKTNTKDDRMQDYQSFFLLTKGTLVSVQNSLNIVYNWRSHYGDDTQIIIDGYRWKIKIANGSVREFKGINEKPLDFDYMINELESLVYKPLGSTPMS